MYLGSDFENTECSDSYETLSSALYKALSEIKQQRLEHLLIEKNEAWQGTVLLYAAQVTSTTSLIEGLCNIGEEKALTLAYDCWYENHKRVPEDIFNKLMELSYGVLEQYMQGRNWREADRYTYQVMVQACKQETYLSVDSLRNFPCGDLNRIDHLWQTYSNRTLGFSVQKEIWVDVGGKLDFAEDIQAAIKAVGKLSDEVGWRLDGQWSFYDGIDFDSPEEKPGCLPAFLFFGRGRRISSVWLRFLVEVVVLFSRIPACKV